MVAFLIFMIILWCLMGGLMGGLWVIGNRSTPSKVLGVVAILISNVAMTLVFVGIIRDVRGDSVLEYEECQEDEILVPSRFDGPDDATYVCVTLDDFADDGSIARLDILMED